MEKRNKRIEIQHIIKKNRCLCCCCEINKLRKIEKRLDDEVYNLKIQLNKLKKEEEKYNPLYILTFERKEDYNNIYSKYPHSYLKEAIKGICKKQEVIFILTKHPILRILNGKISNSIMNMIISKINSKI